MTKNISMNKVQTLSGHIAKIGNGIGLDEFEQITSSVIQELLEAQDEDLIEFDLEEILNQTVDEKA